MDILNDLLIYLTSIFISCAIRTERNGEGTLYCYTLNNFYSYVNIDNSSYQDVEVIGRSYGPYYTLKSNSFINHTHIKSILLSNVVGRIEPNALYGLGALENVHININFIPILEAHAFNISGNFSLALVYNNIEEIEPGTFGNIDRIFLTNNKISKIQRGVFSNLDIRVLNLQDNEISFIEDGAFYGMNKLHYLNLDDNKLTNFNSKKYFDDITNLKILCLSNNQLLEVGSTTFDFAPSLLLLDLINISLSEIPKDTFKNLESLELLDLTNNNLTDIDPNIFSVKNNLKYLYLTNNNLTFLSPKFLERCNNLKNIAIFDNPLQCVCKNDLEKWGEEIRAQMYCWSSIKCIENSKDVCNYDKKEAVYEIIEPTDECGIDKYSTFMTYYSQI